MELTHRKAFELLQKSIDGRIDVGELAKLERHLATCAQCQADAALHRQLEEQALAHRPMALPSQEDIQQTIRKTRAHHRKRQMSKRLSNPVRVAAWATAAVALVLVVVWIFNTIPGQPQTGAPEVTRIVEPVEVTRVVKETVVVDPTPEVFAEAEKEAVVAVGEGVADNRAVGDRDAVIAVFHKDLIGFYAFRDESGTWTYQDILDNPDWFAEPYRRWLDEYEVLVSPDLAVVFGVMSDQYGTRSRITSVYKKEDGEWKVIHTHESYAGP